MADSLTTQATALVRQFYTRFHGLAAVEPSPKELRQARRLLVDHGLERAQYLIAYSAERAPLTRYQPQTFGGILHYLPRALAAFAARTTSQTSAHEWAWQERYAQWRQQALARLRATLAPEDVAGLEEGIRARLLADRTPAFALRLAMRIAVDEVLEARAGLPSFEAWRAAQRRPQEGPFGDHEGASCDEGGSRHAS